MQTLKFTVTGFPPNAGRALADEVLADPPSGWEQLIIDVADNPSSALISSFFNSFLQRIAEERPAALEEARRVKWALKYDFQKANVARWMKDFKPQAGATA